MDLLDILDGKKKIQIIYDYLLKSIEEWNLDMQKCVGFECNKATPMFGQILSVAIRLKIKIIPFVTSVHCITHKTNLTTLEAAKSIERKSLPTKIDAMAKFLAVYFKKFGKKIVPFMELKENKWCTKDHKKIL